MSKAEVDPRGWPDYTYPMTIIGQELNVAIDIAAQSIPTLDVNIAASAVTMDINIASSAVTLNINIESISEGVVFNVAQSGTWTVNAAQTGDWTIKIGSISAGVTFNVNIESISEGVTFNVAQSGAWTINAVQSGDWSINIESVTEGVTFNVNITGATTTLDVNITGSDVTLNVNIAGSSVAINIKTETGANIVIDKLVESAYTEERRTISNNGTSATLTANNKTYMRGKFFPRGCRGFIRQVQIYCDNQDTVGHVFTIRISPMPGMGAIIEKDLTVAGGLSADWRTVVIDALWPYDSLFIWVQSDSDTYGRLGYDDGSPYDYFYSTDGAAWTTGNARYWFRILMAGQTVGDLPVSGTINAVMLPRSVSRVDSGTVTVPAGSYQTLASVEGAGEMVSCLLTAGNSSVVYKVICDGEVASEFTFDDLHAAGFTASTPGLSLLLFTSGAGDNRLWDTRPFSFNRKLEIRVENPLTSSVLCRCRLTAKIIK